MKFTTALISLIGMGAVVSYLSNKSSYVDSNHKYIKVRTFPLYVCLGSPVFEAVFLSLIGLIPRCIPNGGIAFSLSATT